jgi:hypothetical protein
LSTHSHAHTLTHARAHVLASASWHGTAGISDGNEDFHRNRRVDLVSTAGILSCSFSPTTVPHSPTTAEHDSALSTVLHPTVCTDPIRAASRPTRAGLSSP